MDSRLFESLCISNVAVISGIRPFGRTVDNSESGRRCHGLLYIFSGEAIFFCNDKSIKANQKDLLYIPKGAKYKMQYSAESTTFVLVNFEAFDKSGTPLCLYDDIHAVARDDAANKLAKIMASFELCSASKNLASSFRRKELLYRLFGAIFSADSLIGSSDVKNAGIQRGVLLLEQTYIENLPISEFAKVSHVSVGTFRSAFNKLYKMSPVQYRNHLRISRARELLLEGSSTVAEAAYASGFENIGYFCRLYKRLVGESPSETKNGTTNALYPQ